MAGKTRKQPRKTSLVFTKKDMERQRQAILQFLAIPTFKGTDPNASSDKYAFFGKGEKIP